MPLDGRSYYREELAIIDLTESLLGDSRRWCKHHTRRRRAWGLLPPAYCLMGAFSVAVSNDHDYVMTMLHASPPVQHVWRALNEAVPPRALDETGGGSPAISFNDLDSTTYADIIALLERARAKFV